MTRYRLTVVAENENPDYKPFDGQAYYGRPDPRQPHEQIQYVTSELSVVLNETQYQAVQKAVLETFK